MAMRKALIAALVVGAMGLAATTLSARDGKRVVVDGSTTVGPIAKAFAETYMAKHPDVQISVSESGSGNGAKSLINGACDVADMSRPMKASETQAARDAGILAVEHVVAMDGMVIVVHLSNPLGAITLDQLKEIYAGTIQSWKALGGPDQPIVVISRDTNSGTYETFETLVMKGTKMSPRTEYVGSNGAIRERVMATPAAIGYVGLAFTEGVKAIKANGITPSAATVLDRTYPLARPLFMYTNGKPKEGTPLFDFVNMANTTEGKKIIDNVGFVPLP
jgi:phosphate transport system substrate-binding protein